MTAALLLTAALSLPARAQADAPPGAPAPQESWEARLVKATGSVYVRSAGEEDWRTAEADLPLEAGDEVQTSDEGSAEIALEGDNLIELGPGGDYTVASLSKDTAAMEMNAGSLIAKLASFLGRHTLEIRTPDAVAAIRGTEFGVDLEDEGRTHVGVFDEGKVAVRPAGSPAGSGEVTLQPGQELAAAKGRPFQPVALAHFAAQRQRMARMRTRLAAFRKTWRPLALQRRQALRQRFRQKRVLRKEQFLKRRQAWIKRRAEKRRSQLRNQERRQQQHQIQQKRRAERQTQRKKSQVKREIRLKKIDARKKKKASQAPAPRH